MIIISKNIKPETQKIESRWHPSIHQVQIIENKPNFPISWLNIQGYCEYSLYLENFQHIHIEDTQQMTTGTDEHQILEDEFKKTATVMSYDEMQEISQKQKVVSREFFVISSTDGIRGFIDEIWIMPDRIVIIDDKPGDKAYDSMKNQVYAYALAYQQMNPDDKRDIYVALRTRLTDNIFWQTKFTSEEKYQIKRLISRMQQLITGKTFFKPTSNSNKCKACRFNQVCDNSMSIK